MIYPTAPYGISTRLSKIKTGLIDTLLQEPVIRRGGLHHYISAIAGVKFGVFSTRIRRVRYTHAIPRARSRAGQISVPCNSDIASTLGSTARLIHTSHIGHVQVASSDLTPVHPVINNRAGLFDGKPMNRGIASTAKRFAPRTLPSLLRFGSPLGLFHWYACRRSSVGSKCNDWPLKASS